METLLTFPGVMSPLLRVANVFAALVLLPVSAASVVVGFTVVPAFALTIPASRRVSIPKWRKTKASQAVAKTQPERSLGPKLAGQLSQMEVSSWLMVGLRFGRAIPQKVLGRY